MRTNESFLAQTDEDHHHGPKPLQETTLKMVTGFPLDYMHLVCLGVIMTVIDYNEKSDKCIDKR